MMHRNIYGTPSGSYLILESPNGIIPPPHISSHVYLGSVSDMVTALNYHMKQADIAEAIGVVQQEVSRWMNGVETPRSGSRVQYSSLVREYMTRCMLVPDHIHTLDMYRANAHAGRRGPRKKAVPA